MIIRVKCRCGAEIMVNARAAYMGMSCSTCGSQISTRKTAAAVEPGGGIGKIVALSVVGVFVVAGLTWGLVAAFSGEDQVHADFRQDDGNQGRGDGLRHDPTRGPQRSEAVQLAQLWGDDVVDTFFDGGLGVSTNVFEEPLFDHDRGRWTIPVRIEWEGKESAWINETARRLGEETVSRTFWVQGELDVGQDGSIVYWSERPNGRSPSLDVYMDVERPFLQAIGLRGN